MNQAWKCTACGTADRAEREGRSSFCGDCKRARGIFNTTRGNLRSGFNRTKKGSPDLGFSADEFCVWRKEQRLRCCYYGIAEEDLSTVGMKSQIQRVVKVLGVDRVDSSLGYTLENLAPCCFVCNQVKGDRFTADEMREIGPSIGRVWQSRLQGGIPVRELAAAVEIAERADGQEVESRHGPASGNEK